MCFTYFEKDDDNNKNSSNIYFVMRIINIRIKDITAVL